jgi:CheY-like chemotaxis protein
MVDAGLATSRKTIVVARGGASLPGESIFARREFLVRRAGSGAQACAMLRTGTACLLVVGPSLEDTGVDQLVAEVRADPALRRTSILFVGDTADAPTAAAATGAGANVALLRPFDERELVHAVARLANVAPRRTTRLLVRLRVGIRADDFRVGFTRNVSSSGMLLEADSGLDVGSLLGLRFFVPGKTEEVSADGEVVRLHGLTGVRSVVGVHFVTIGSDDRTLIRTFVAARAPTV